MKLTLGLQWLTLMKFSKYIIFVVTNLVLWLAYQCQCVHMLTVIGHKPIKIPKMFKMFKAFLV